ncbi:hypothetical protein NFY79_000087 [Escherichia coli]|nr:hypothetical protein [Escherichia coli]EKI8622359.1 hypothetical protein [Escherichia coli]
MTEAEMLKMIRRVTGANQAAGKQEATQPDSVIAENYARVVAEVVHIAASSKTFFWEDVHVIDR